LQGQHTFCGGGKRKEREEEKLSPELLYTMDADTRRPTM